MQVQASANEMPFSNHIGILQEMFLLFCFLFPAGFGFFLIMLALSLPGQGGTTKAASVLIIALTANRIGRMFSAMFSAVPVFKMHDAVISGFFQSLGLMSIFIATLQNGVQVFFIIGAFFLGIGLTAGNVFFRTLLTTGISRISNISYSVLFYVLWGIGIAFAGLVWSLPFLRYIILTMVVISLAGCFIARRILSKQGSGAANEDTTSEWKATTHYMQIFALSMPATIVACIAILFNAALIPVLTKNFGFSVAETGIAACFIVIGNILAIFKIPKKLAPFSSALPGFCFSVIGNIVLVACLFLLRDSKVSAFLTIVGIGWFSALSLKFQMDFVRVNAGNNIHRLIHSLSEVLSVAGGIGFAFLNKTGFSLLTQFTGIALILFIWWSAVSNRYGKGEQYG
mgnify:FL=1